MPHFIIECSNGVIQQKAVQELNKMVHSLAMSSGLFEEKSVKVRCNSYSEYLIAGEKDGDFLHVFGHIMGGRTSEQKAELSTIIVKALKKEFPTTDVVTMNVYEFDPETYRNKNQFE